MKNEEAADIGKNGKKTKKIRSERWGEWDQKHKCRGWSWIREITQTLTLKAKSY